MASYSSGFNQYGPTPRPSTSGKGRNGAGFALPDVPRIGPTGNRPEKATSKGGAK